MSRLKYLLLFMSLPPWAIITQPLGATVQVTATVVQVFGAILLIVLRDRIFE